MRENTQDENRAYTQLSTTQKFSVERALIVKCQ